MARQRLVLLTESDAEVIRRIGRKLDALDGPGVTNAPDGVTIAPTPPRGKTRPEGRRDPRRVMTVVIDSIANDTLSVKRIDADGDPEGDAFTVAKPWKLRHDADEYPDVSALTTTNAQEVEVTSGGEDYTWLVTPTYSVGDHIVIGRAWTGLDDGGTPAEPIRWIDLNVDARAWATPCEAEEEE
jgi:hypothetical protein